MEATLGLNYIMEPTFAMKPTRGCVSSPTAYQPPNFDRGSYVSSNFIRNKTSPSNINNDYVTRPETFSIPPATRVYVRVNPKYRRFEINKRVAPRLILTRHRPYLFNVVMPNNVPFSLFDKDGNYIVTPTTRSSYGFTPDSDTPTELFYGCKTDNTIPRGQVVIRGQ